MLRLSRRKAFIILAALVAIGAVGAYGWIKFRAADTGLVYTGLVEGVAVGGYDSVAYFTKGEAVEGSPSITARFRGAEWRFSSDENRKTFEAEPEKYAPAYGGYCAWATAQGYPAKGDPHYWDIIDGRLYLNYDGNIQKKWRADIPGFIAKADRNWPKIVEP